MFLLLPAVFLAPVVFSAPTHAAPPLDPALVDCSTIKGPKPGVNCADCSNVAKCPIVTKYVNPLINFLAAVVGVAVVISMVIGGIQYSQSAGDPQAASAAKNRIRNAIIALVTFLFLYALLNFLVPGGIF